jgi:hypothetical protein
MPQQQLTSMLQKHTPRRRSVLASSTTAARATPPQNGSPSDTPNTRKRAQINYATLQNHGFDDPAPLDSPTPSARTTKRARTQASQASQSQVLQPEATQETIDIDVKDEDNEEDTERKKPGWFWKYYTAKELSITYEKGRGKTKQTVKDIEYACTIHNGSRCGY